MKSNKNSLRLMLVLIAFGVAALFAGPKSLFILVPAALFIYEAGATLRSDRN